MTRRIDSPFPVSARPCGSFDDIDGFLREVFRGIPARMPANNAAPAQAWPALNVREDAGAFHVDADVPGLTMENLDVSFDKGTLTISGARVEEHDEKEGATHRRERVTGEFSRKINLGAEIDTEKVDATLDNGVLRVRLPKAEASKSRKISVRPGK